MRFDRRDFIKLGTAGVAGVLGHARCAFAQSTAAIPPLMRSSSGDDTTPVIGVGVIPDGACRSSSAALPA